LASGLWTSGFGALTLWCMRELLLCPPDYFGIEYEINPWMDRTRKAVPVLACAQWRIPKDSL
jgi:hypothetical protein